MHSAPVKWLSDLTGQAVTSSISLGKEDGGLRSDARDQKAGIRGQRSEDGHWMVA